MKIPSEHLAVFLSITAASVNLALAGSKDRGALDRSDLAPLSISRNGDDEIHLQVVGAFPEAPTIWASLDLQRWTAIGTAVASESVPGEFLYVDTVLNRFQHRFYLASVDKAETNPEADESATVEPEAEDHAAAGEEPSAHEEGDGFIVPPPGAFPEDPVDNPDLSPKDPEDEPKPAPPAPAPAPIPSPENDPPEQPGNGVNGPLGDDEEPVDKFGGNNNPGPINPGPDADPDSRQPGVEEKPCPPDGVALLEAEKLHAIFEALEALRKKAADAEDEFEKNALVAEIRTFELLFRIVSNNIAGPWAHDFNNAVLGMLQGDKRRMQNVIDPVVFKEALAFVRYSLYWQAQYRSNLTAAEKKQIRLILDQLDAFIDQLCQIKRSDPQAKEKLAKLKEEICRYLTQQQVKSEAFKKLVAQLAEFLVKEGIVKLVEIMLAETFGEGFAGKVTNAFKAILDILNAVDVFIKHGEKEEALRRYNLMLLELLKKAKALKTVKGMPVFQVPGGNLVNAQVWHSKADHVTLVKTVVIPVMRCWNPKKDGKPGEGEWIKTQLKFKDGSNRKEFAKDKAVQEGDAHVHAFDIQVPQVQEGAKCFIVLETTRCYKNPQGKTWEQREDYFVGVVMP